MHRSRPMIYLPAIHVVFFTGWLLLMSSAIVSAAHLEKVVGNVEKPITLKSPPEDARRFFIEQEGRIRIIDEAGQLLPAPFLDITSLVEWDGLFQGLLGFSFHPNYGRCPIVS